MERRTGQVSTSGLLARPHRLRGTNPDCLRTTSKSPSKMFGMKERQSSSVFLAFCWDLCCQPQLLILAKREHPNKKNVGFLALLKSALPPQPTSELVRAAVLFFCRARCRAAVLFHPSQYFKSNNKKQPCCFFLVVISRNSARIQQRLNYCPACAPYFRWETLVTRDGRSTTNPRSRIKMPPRAHSSESRLD